MRVLICGGRDFNDRFLAFHALEHLHAEVGVTAVITGGAHGADTLGHLWARFRGIPTEVYPADWEKNGRAAGAIRNRVMLAVGKPDLVVAFPGGKGTANMILQATNNRVEIRKIS